ncbi:MAG: aminotransferase class I/II-fold pyridoxal phosphate-dependent enzyme [Melioribacter sp.]|nr:aminotransferase class I/II-fold pyridoxal phosphate-dependent enzyme [Melioribacter sp.]
MKETLEYFQLSQIKAAKVSEISEATVSSPVPPEERVNFHIGNPIQDERLYSAYLRMVLGIDIRREEFNINTLEEIREELGWSKNEKGKLEFLTELIKKSAPYTPRGGFVRNNPHFVVNYFNDWLIKNQQEPLAYDLGDKSGKRELILSSGGIYEALRIFFHCISSFLVHKPANIFSYGILIPEYLKIFPDIFFYQLPDDEEVIISLIEKYLKSNSNKPNFLLLGKLTREKTRRRLRKLSLELPLFFVEVNNAPNHLSLAREAKMMNRVIRIITPEVFSPRFKNLSINYIVGNSEYIKVFETLHFQLKGTPSSTEIELLSYLLKNNLLQTINKNGESVEVKPEYESSSVSEVGYNFLSNKIKALEERLEGLIKDKSKKIENIIDKISYKEEELISRSRKYFPNFLFDRFSGYDVRILLNELLANLDSDEWQEELINSFLSAFLNYHPEYQAEFSIVVSGSSRTALSLLGFHCGIRDVIIPDLSWTYEHCFPSVTVVPLTEDFQLNITALKNAVEYKLNKDSNWKNYGAIIFNNPHNATGQVFNELEIKEFLKWLLEKEIFIIDDLAYQNVAPSQEFKTIKTIRQLCNELAEEGYISEEQSEFVITIQSMSKTDSYAGARLSVVEIRNKKLLKLYKEINSYIRQNLAAIFLSYLFYRNRVETINAYYRLRNKIFKERSEALLNAVENFPAERNRFNIKIKPPVGSMYPQMIIERLPSGLSLDWLASSLARQGIGLVPLSTFARTEQGFDTGRRTFRLTLGGTDGAEALQKKTRRVLIDLNRIIAEEASNYNKRQLNIKPINVKRVISVTDNIDKWSILEEKIKEKCNDVFLEYAKILDNEEEIKENLKRFEKEFVPERLFLFRRRFEDRINIINEYANLAFSDNGKSVAKILEKEFYKDDLQIRKEKFQKRLYDRTVHPTQMYSIKSEILFEKVISNLIRNKDISEKLISDLRKEIVKEFLGLNVQIISGEEPQEVILDLDSQIAAENYFHLYSDYSFQTYLSFWGDWDGSNRPSGQGHSLVAGVLIENVVRQAKIIELILKYENNVNINPSLIEEIEKLPQNNKRFTDLLNEITLLTHQLEKRYKGLLPFNIEVSRIRRLGIKLHLAQDPIMRMWKHNDRLERKMLELRHKRRVTLEYYFSLNKQLRKTLHSLIPVIQRNISNPEFFIEAGMYRDLLKRFVVTPRIHQKLITAQDQFAIDTTVHNINEINEISGKYGNPGMVLAIQISMTTKPEALISLDRKLYSKREQILRENSELDLPNIWIIPLFEDLDSVKNLENYLNKIWEYSFQSRRINQETHERFSEIITEIFVAGSDLSQQVGQTAALSLYKQAKFELMKWLATHNLIGKVRMKMGNGEPMQRQGGYYSSVAGKPAFIKSEESKKRFLLYLEESTKRSTEYASTPLLGVLANKDLLTLQSNISEKIRYLPVEELTQLLYHLKESQRFYQAEILRAGEPLSETRLQYKTRGLHELERLTLGKQDEIYNEFLQIYTQNFRQILYGREEDVVGIHIISYFIGRTIPPLRDRPTVRPGQNEGELAGTKILERIAGTIPLCKYGSLLRAIAHNQSQTMILGVNQLTTGLFRALNNFSQREFAEGEAEVLISERILPNLPVYEILHTLRIYHEQDLKYITKIEKAFPAGNSALIALREDNDSLQKYLPYFQKELLRRHGVDVSEFFDKDKFIPDLLPTLRPDIAVLLQPNFFNTNINTFVSEIKGSIDDNWFNEVEKLLSIPVKISNWRKKIWEFLEIPIYQRVSSFVELAISLNNLSSNLPVKEYLFTPKKLKISPQLIGISKSTIDNNMQQFLTAAFEYLSIISQGMAEVPINIIRAIKEVESIIKIEDQPLSAKNQDLLRFYLLQIARLAGENG